MRRRRRLPSVGARNCVPGRHLQRRHEYGHFGLDLRWKRSLQGGHDDYVRAVRVQGRQCLLAFVHVGRERMLGRQRVHQQLVRQEADRIDVHDERRMSERHRRQLPLRGRGLL